MIIYEYRSYITCPDLRIPKGNRMIGNGEKRLDDGREVS